MTWLRNTILALILCVYVCVQTCRISYVALNILSHWSQTLFWALDDNGTNLRLVWMCALIWPPLSAQQRVPSRWCLPDLPGHSQSTVTTPVAAVSGHLPDVHTEVPPGTSAAA